MKEFIYELMTYSVTFIKGLGEVGDFLLTPVFVIEGYSYTILTLLTPVAFAGIVSWTVIKWLNPFS